MASTTSPTSIHSLRNCLIIASSRTSQPSKQSSLRIISHHTEPSRKPEQSLSLAKSAAVAGTVISTLASSPLALAAKQIAESPNQDNRGLALLLPVVPAVGWVLYNILGPALRQINKMRSDKGVVYGLGLGGLAAYCALFVPIASAAAEAVEAEAESGGGSSGSLALIVAAAVGLEVILFSTMQSKYEEEGAKH